MRRIAVIATTGALAALGIVAAPASAIVVAPSSTSLQNGSGQPYTGTISGSAVGNAVLHTDIGDITCNQAPISGAITNAGSSGNPALGNFDTSDFTNNDMQACPDDTAANHENFNSLGLPWGLTFNWIDNNTTGAPNATVLMSPVSIFIDLDLADCTYRADHNNSGGAGNQVLADVYNPDNSPTHHLEIRLVNEPFDTADALCSAFAPTGNGTVTWQLTGAAAAELSVREKVQPPVCNNASVSTPFQTAVPITLNCTGVTPLTYNVQVGDPAHGTLTPAGPPNGFTYTPNAGYSGPDTIHFSANNAGGSSNTATVNVTVGAAPQGGGAGSGGAQGQVVSGKRCKKKKAKHKSAAAAKKCRKKKK